MARKLNMRVLVTRPIDDAAATAAELTRRGHHAVVAPLLEIEFCEGPALSLDNVQAILATSSNGAKAFARRSDRRDLPVFAVGKQTAAVARTLGFLQVRSADGDARALAEAVPAWANPERGALLHAAGAENPGRLVADLAARGFEVQTAALYRAVPVRRLPTSAREALEAGAVDAILLYSPRTAQTFADCLIDDEELRRCCQALLALCISEAAAAPLKSLSFRAVRWPERPDQDAMLALLD